MLSFEEGDEGPSVLIVNAGDVLEGDHDMVDVPAMHIQLQKFLDLGAGEVVLIRLVNHQVLVDVVSHEESATRRRAEGRALAPANALYFVEVYVGSVFLNGDLEHALLGSYYHVDRVEQGHFCDSDLVVGRREYERIGAGHFSMVFASENGYLVLAHKNVILIQGDHVKFSAQGDLVGELDRRD